MELFLTAAGALALVTALVNCAKYVKNGDTNGWLTQVLVWIAGIAVVLLLRESDFAGTFTLGTMTLDHANTATAILAGLGLGSTAMLTNDLKKAVDRSDSAAKPDLVKPPAGP